MNNIIQASVIVPAYNAASTIATCIESLLAQRTADTFEIVVVDDGSTDDTAEIARRYSEVKILQPPNRGAAAARNLGALEARGHVLCMIDADCVATPGWLAALEAAIRAGADGAKGTLLSKQKEVVARFTQLEYEDRYDRMDPARPIDFIDTGSAAYRRDLFLKVGGFDENLVEDEDQELSFRLAERGGNLRFVPEAKVYHRHPTTPLAYARRKFDIGRWKVMVLLRHPTKAVSDSHTPQAVKAQMLLFPGIASLALASLFKREMLRFCLFLFAMFLASAAPFMLKVIHKDPQVALLTPFLLCLRAASLGTGLLYGLITFVPPWLAKALSKERPQEASNAQSA